GLGALCLGLLEGARLLGQVVPALVEVASLVPVTAHRVGDPTRGRVAVATERRTSVTALAVGRAAAAVVATRTRVARTVVAFAALRTAVGRTVTAVGPARCGRVV